MNDPILHLLGLARKAGRLEAGEEPVNAACRARQAKLILVAGDAAANTFRRAAHFGQAGNVLWLPLPHSKQELGSALGRSSCAMAALTDVGLAAALVKKLAGLDPERYGPAAGQLSQKADKALQRQREQRRHEKNIQRGKKKPWAAPPKEGSRPPRAPQETAGRSSASGGGDARPSRAPAPPRKSGKSLGNGPAFRKGPHSPGMKGRPAGADGGPPSKSGRPKAGPGGRRMKGPVPGPKHKA